MEELSASILGTSLTLLTTSPSICHPEQTPGEAGVPPGTQEVCTVEEER